MRVGKLLTGLLLLLCAPLATACDAFRGSGVIVPGDGPATDFAASSDPASGALCTSFCINNGGHLLHGANLEHQFFCRGLLYLNRRGVSKVG